MNKLNTPGLLTFLMITLSLTFSGCDLVGDIFEFGFWTAIIITAVVIGGIYFVVRMFKR